jgi:hypothetical protein
MGAPSRRVANAPSLSHSLGARHVEAVDVRICRYEDDTDVRCAQRAEAPHETHSSAAERA